MGIALNKTTLKAQRDQAKTFKQFLPSLELRRQQLLAAVKAARAWMTEIEIRIEENRRRLDPLYPLLGSSNISTLNTDKLVRVRALKIETENVVGTRVPVLRDVDFEYSDYSMLATPFWFDHLIESLRQMCRLRVEHQVARQRLDVLEREARRITQRVNLFEKILIPQAEQNIRRIVIFLSDQERAAVVRSKISKKKQSADA